jgi:hypothetical protein
MVERLQLGQKELLILFCLKESMDSHIRFHQSTALTLDPQWRLGFQSTAFGICEENMMTSGGKGLA